MSCCMGVSSPCVRPLLADGVSREIGSKDRKGDRVAASWRAELRTWRSSKSPKERIEQMPAVRTQSSELLKPAYARRGFLPETDPLAAFPSGSPYAALDEIGRDLPSLLHDKAFRTYARALRIPKWEGPVSEETLPQLRLYYVRVGFLAAAYVNQIGAEPAETLPRSVAEPLIDAAKRLKRPPILSYDGYALYNWKRFRKDGPIRLGNIDTIQNFVHMYDEHWFILVHVEIEAIAADILGAIAAVKRKQIEKKDEDLRAELWRIEKCVRRQVEVLKRIPEHMDSKLYYKTFRPYIRFFENVTYEGVDHAPMHFSRRDRRAKQHHADAGRLHEDSPPTIRSHGSPRRYA